MPTWKSTLLFLFTRSGLGAHKSNKQRRGFLGGSISTRHATRIPQRDAAGATFSAAFIAVVFLFLSTAHLLFVSPVAVISISCVRTIGQRCRRKTEPASSSSLAHLHRPVAGRRRFPSTSRRAKTKRREKRTRRSLEWVLRVLRMRPIQQPRTV